MDCKRSADKCSTQIVKSHFTIDVHPAGRDTRRLRKSRICRSDKDEYHRHYDKHIAIEPLLGSGSDSYDRLCVLLLDKGGFRSEKRRVLVTDYVVALTGQVLHFWSVEKSDPPMMICD